MNLTLGNKIKLTLTNRPKRECDYQFLLNLIQMIVKESLPVQIKVSVSIVNFVSI